MSLQPVAAERTVTRTLAWPWVMLSYLVVGLAALLPRVLDLGVFLSGDESEFWLRRSDVFLQALRAHDWPTTALSTHPGVTTMWLGSIGLLLRDLLSGWGLLPDQSFATFLTLMRLPTALTHVVTVLIGYTMLRRMFAPSAALLAGLFWATDPFVVGFSRVLHVDALAGSFLTLSLLAACSYWHHDRRARWLVGSAVGAGLAILSKSPALALVPWVGLVALLGATTDPSPPLRAGDRRPTTESLRSAAVVGGLWSVVVPLLAWAAICATTVFALWPALWVAPLRAYDQMRTGVEAEGAQPHMFGNFFLGREDDAPGPLFYPVALALRLTPWTMLGLFLLAVAWRRAKAIERRDLAALAGFALLFILAMTVFPKKFNRYLVPIFPSLDILAACGIVWAQQRLTDLLRQRGLQLHVFARGLPAALAGMALLAVLNAWWWHPYEIVYFNQALGGAPAGANTFTTGWGEGLSEVAAWLNAQPDITGVLTVSTMVNGLQEYMRKGARAIGRDGPLPPKAGYVVIYVRQIQWNKPWPPFDQFYGPEVPLHVVRIHGVDYAWIYRVPPPVAQPAEADFGADLHLRGLEPVGKTQRGQTLTYRLFWKTSNLPLRDYTMFAHLIGADGRRYAQSDLPYPTSTWGAYRYVTSDLAIGLPAELPAGTYQLVIGLYDPQTGQRLPLRSSALVDPALDGPDALVLTGVRVEP